MIFPFSSINNQLQIKNDNIEEQEYFNQIFSLYLFRISIYAVVPLLLFGSYFYYKNGHIVYGLIENLYALFLLFLTFFNLVNYVVKKYLFLISFYLFSIFILITAGINTLGVTSMLSSSLLIGLVSERKRGFFHILYANMIAFFIFTILLYNGTFDNLEIYNYKNMWGIIVIGFNSYLLCLLLVIKLYKNILAKQFVTAHNNKIFLNNIIDSVSSAIITLDNDQRIVLINSKAKEMFELTNEFIGTKYDDLFKNKVSVPMPGMILPCIFEDYYTNGDYHYYDPLGHIIYVNRECLKLFDQSDNVIGSVFVIKDISKRITKELELEYLHYHDSLTNLHNRLFFDKELKRLDRKKYLPLSMIMIDINGLKVFNDSFGRKFGDNILVKIGDLIQQVTKASDSICRIGGDEFCIILPNTKQETVIKMIDQLDELVKKTTIYRVKPSISVGHVTKTETKEKMEELYKSMEDSLFMDKLSHNSSQRSRTINLVLDTLYEKNPREMMHSKRVGAYSEALAKKLGLGEKRAKRLHLAGLMHDIGKIAIEESILNKEEKLTDEEWEKCKKHPEIGFRILSTYNEFVDIAQFVYQHHERYDGTGYPKGLKGDDINLESRIISIADSYDAMTSNRTYRKALSKEVAIAELKKNKGKQFDPKLVDKFIAVLEKHEF